MPANKIKLEICGSNYVIATTDPEEYVLSLAEKLDSDMTQMLASNPTASVTTAAVITALGYLDELKKSTSGADNMRAQIKDYLEDAAKAKLAAEQARREVERLQKEVQRLRESRYATWAWNYGFSPPYDMRREARFPAGLVTAHLRVKQGCIQAVRFYGDFFGSGPLEGLEAAMAGLPLDAQLAEALAPLHVEHYMSGITAEELARLLRG